jgi:hypothetical protein
LPWLLARKKKKCLLLRPLKPPHRLLTLLLLPLRPLTLLLLRPLLTLLLLPTPLLLPLRTLLPQLRLLLRLLRKPLRLLLPSNRGCRLRTASRSTALRGGFAFRPPVRAAFFCQVYHPGCQEASWLNNRP